MNTNKTRILLAVMWHMIMLALLSADGIVRTSLLKPGLYWGIVAVTMFTSITMWFVSIIAAQDNNKAKGKSTFMILAEKYNSKHSIWVCIILVIETVFFIALHNAGASFVPYPRPIIFLIIFVVSQEICTLICSRKAA